jgi:hypothetical protein
MMATPHMVAGATIGRIARRPWLASPAAVASHFLLDFTPHLDPHGLFGVPHGGPTRLEVTAGIADFVIGALLVGVLSVRQRHRGVMLGGALFGILIDLLEDVPPVGPWFKTWTGAAWLVGFHHGLQHNVSPAHWPLGFGTQAILLAICIPVCLHRRRKRGTAGEAARVGLTG